MQKASFNDIADGEIYKKKSWWKNFPSIHMAMLSVNADDKTFHLSRWRVFLFKYMTRFSFHANDKVFR